MKDYYAILQIAENSNVIDIRNAYRRLAKKYHPDVNKGSDSTDKFIEISEAYEFLTKHREQYFKNMANESGNNQKSADYNINLEFEKFNQKVREKARQHAKIKFEDFKKQHEAFQKSGMSDLALLFIIIIRIVIIPLVLFLLLLPVYLALTFEWKLIFLMVFTWPIAGILAGYIYDERKHYFMPGKFYYSFKIVKQIYCKTNLTGQNCYYCPSKNANSKPYQLNLLKLKDLKVKSSGFRQHNANYINDEVPILIPRSRKALIIHSINCLVKIVTIILCVSFLGISSYVWRILIGMFTAGIISSLILLITSTKSNVSYLISLGFILRIFVYIFIISIISKFNFSPFNIDILGPIQFVITAILLLDCVIMQILDSILGKYASRPMIKQYNETELKFADGYRVYNDIPVISVVYPIFKWIFA